MTDTARLDWMLATRAVVLVDEDSLTLSFAVDGIIRTVQSNNRDARAAIDKTMAVYPSKEGT